MNQLSKLHDTLIKMKLPSIRDHVNAKCLICGDLQEIMKRVGAIILCSDCCKFTFKSKDPVKEERGIYLQLLKVQEDFSEEGE